MKASMPKGPCARLNFDSAELIGPVDPRATMAGKPVHHVSSRIFNLDSGLGRKACAMA